MNHVTIVGRIGKMKMTASADGSYSILNFSVADNRTKKKTNEPQFYNCVIFRKGAETLGNMANVGDRIAVSGTMEWQPWDKDEKTHLKVLKIIVEHFEMLGKAETVGPDGKPIVPKYKVENDEEIPF